MAIDLRYDWYNAPRKPISWHCITFNNTAFSSKKIIKNPALTWGACAEDCIRHIEWIAKHKKE